MRLRAGLEVVGYGALPSTRFTDEERAAASACLDVVFVQDVGDGEAEGPRPVTIAHAQISEHASSDLEGRLLRDKWRAACERLCRCVTCHIFTHHIAFIIQA